MVLRGWEESERRNCKSNLMNTNLKINKHAGTSRITQGHFRRMNSHLSAGTLGVEITARESPTCATTTSSDAYSPRFFMQIKRIPSAKWKQKQLCCGCWRDFELICRKLNDHSQCAGIAKMGLSRLNVFACPFSQLLEDERRLVDTLQIGQSCMLSR